MGYYEDITDNHLENLLALYREASSKEAAIADEYSKEKRKSLYLVIGAIGVILTVSHLYFSTPSVTSDAIAQETTEHGKVKK